MIEVNELSHSFDDKTNILKAVSFNISQGECVALLGPSGAGKSTLMHILGLLQPIDKGDYFLDGINIQDLTQNQKAHLRSKKIGFIFQHYHLLAELSVLDNIRLPWQYHQSHDYNHLDDLITSLGLTPLLKKKPSQLSGGEQQRVAIARALINHPSVLLADEPTGALDEGNGQLVMSLLKEKRADKTLIIVTHNPKIAEQCDRVLSLKDGKLT